MGKAITSNVHRIFHPTSMDDNNVVFRKHFLCENFLTFLQRTSSWLPPCSLDEWHCQPGPHLHWNGIKEGRYREHHRASFHFLQILLHTCTLLDILESQQLLEVLESSFINLIVNLTISILAETWFLLTSQKYLKKKATSLYLNSNQYVRSIFAKKSKWKL